VKNEEELKKFRILIHMTLINFNKEECFLDILIKKGSIDVKNCFLIFVYNKKDKLIMR